MNFVIMLLISVISARPFPHEQKTGQRQADSIYDRVYELFEDTYGGIDLWTETTSYFD